MEVVLQPWPTTAACSPIQYGMWCTKYVKKGSTVDNLRGALGGEVGESPPCHRREGGAHPSLPDTCTMFHWLQGPHGGSTYADVLLRVRIWVMQLL
jgi:hypothetical protein